MRGIDVIAMLKSVAGDFVKDSRQKINGAELNRLYVGFERKWQISHGETTDTLYRSGRNAPCFSYGDIRPDLL